RREISRGGRRRAVRAAALARGAARHRRAARPSPDVHDEGDGMAGGGFTERELGSLGFRLVVDPATPLLAVHKALGQWYGAMAAGSPDPLLGARQGRAEQQLVHETISLEAMLEIERRTVER